MSMAGCIDFPRLGDDEVLGKRGAITGSVASALFWALADEEKNTDGTFREDAIGCGG